MSLFGRKKEDMASQKPKAEAKAASSEFQAGRDIASVLKKPRITEKAAFAIDRNVYTFIIRKDATKHDVRDAVKTIYDVTPVKVRIVNKKPRHYTSRLRGRDMTEHGMKKVYVYLKKGDRIDLT